MVSFKAIISSLFVAVAVAQPVQLAAEPAASVVPVAPSVAPAATTTHEFRPFKCELCIDVSKIILQKLHDTAQDETDCMVKVQTVMIKDVCPHLEFIVSKQKCLMGASAASTTLCDKSKEIDATQLSEQFCEATSLCEAK